MRTWVLRIAIFFFQFFLRLRYRVRYKGLDEINRTLAKKAMKEGRGVLFFPNHPTVLIDPLLITLPLLINFRVRPLITEYMYYNPLFHKVLQWIGALPVPNFSVGVNPLKLDRLQKTLSEVDEGLQKGESFVIYPAGTTKVGSKEIIGGAFAAHDLCYKHPNSYVVLVRTTGLWGSRFSRARTQGNQIDMISVLRYAAKLFFINFIFFAPKRDVLVEFELAHINRDSKTGLASYTNEEGTLATTAQPQEPVKLVARTTANDNGVLLPINKGRLEFNKTLEKWYNKPFEQNGQSAVSGEPLHLIAETIWKKSIETIRPYETQDCDTYDISQNVKETVIKKIAELSCRAESSIHLQDHLIADIGLDSLNIAELVSYIEMRFDKRGINLQEISSVLKACLAAEGHSAIQKDIVDPDIDTKLWEKPCEVTRLFIPEAQTILDAFFTTSQQQQRRGIIGDAKSGIITYAKIRSTVFLLAREFMKIEGENIGILLPASVIANILVLSLQLAGKTPVMINWTVGGSHLESVVQHAKLQAVLTSWSFLDRLENVDVNPIKNILIVLEEAKARFSLSSYFIAKGTFWLPWQWIKKYTSFFPSWQKITADSKAVILFTSGTENMPKGVPLTHGNILSNLRATLLSIELHSTDRVIGILPPFHSFGFSITGLMPILAGLRTFYSPNPLDAPRIAHSIQYWKISLLCSAPSFLKNILRQTTLGKPLDTVRYIVSGAERATDDLLHLVTTALPHAHFVEGYGITECSPVLTANTKGRGNGVGLPLSNVRIKIVDPEDYSKTRNGVDESGMILAAGPNIFHNYLQPGLSSPFFVDKDTMWYITGDIGKFDSQAQLHITGRVKRFMKIGGEMISLGAVEDALEKSFRDQITIWKKAREEKNQDHRNGKMKSPIQDLATSSFAVVAVGEDEGKAKLTVFSTLSSLDVLEVNMALRKSGFSNLVRVDRIVQLDEFPLMGTGKVAYRSLEDMSQHTFA